MSLSFPCLAIISVARATKLCSNSSFIDCYSLVKMWQRYKIFLNNKEITKKQTAPENLFGAVCFFRLLN